MRLLFEGMERGRRTLGAARGCFFIALWMATQGFPVEDLVGRLPGQPTVNFRQFAGYIDVDVDAGRSLFYYFAEGQQDPHLLPLTLWLNGGLVWFRTVLVYDMIRS